MKPLIAGNWKMNGRAVSIVELDGVISRYDADLHGKVDLMLCPPTTLLARFADRAMGTAVEIGAQDCHTEASGAHTGDISAEMLRDTGAVAVIVGHSERRTDHGETSELVRAKAEAARRAGLLAILCVGETAAERHSGDTLAIIGAQLAAGLPAGMTGATLVVAYEPVWAIGTGLTPTVADVAEVHGFIRARLVEAYGADGPAIRILYGGSVKPANAKELLAVKDVDGALVGGASLKASDFLAIAEAYR